MTEDKNIAVKKIETKSLGYQYPNSDCPALCDVSCELRVNKKICLVGANGSGKSTFAKIISGLYEQYTGTVLMDGCDFRSTDNEDLFSQIDFGQQKLIKYPFSFQSISVLTNMRNKNLRILLKNVFLKK